MAGNYVGFAWRTTQAVRMIHHLTLGHNGNIRNISNGVRTDWYGNGTAAVVKDARMAMDGFLSRKDQIFIEMSQGMEAISEISRQNEKLGEASLAETSFYAGLAGLCRRMQNNEEIDASEITAQITGLKEIIKSKSWWRSRRLEKKFEGLFKSLGTVLTTNSAASVQEATLRAADLSSKLSAKDITKAWGLRILSALAITVSVLYSSYRLYTLGAVIAAGMVSGPLLITAAGLLFVAELFFNGLAVKYFWSVVKNARKAIGEGWYPEIRESLVPDPEKRPFYAYLLTMVDEPASAIRPNVISHVRTALRYGKKCHTFVADMSSFLFNKMSANASANKGKEMVARKLVIEKMISALGVERIKADEISSVLAFEGTEIDDPDCRFHSVARVAELAQPYSISQRSIRKLGRTMATCFESFNFGGVNDLLRTTITQEAIREQLIELGVDPLKVETLAHLMRQKLDSLVRQANIAKLAYAIFQGQALSEESLSLFYSHLQEEFDLSEEQAKRIVAQIDSNYEQINRAADKVVGRYDFSANRGSVEQRKLFYLAHEIMSQFAENNKRISLIAGSLREKCNHVVQSVLHCKFGKSKKISNAIALGINGLYKFGDKVEGFIAREGLPFEQAVQKAMQERKSEIAAVVQRVGTAEGLDAGQVEEMADKLFEVIEESYEYKHFAAVEFLGAVVAKVEDVLGKDPAVLEEKLLEEVLKAFNLGNSGDKKQKLSIAISLVLQDLGISKRFSAKQREELDKILESTADPAKNKDTKDALIEKLERELGLPKPLAEQIVTAYIEMFNRQVGKIKELVKSAEALALRRAIPKVEFEGIPGVDIDLKAIKEEVDERVQLVRNPYRGGAKAGVADGLIKGWSIPVYIGEAERKIVMRMVEERIFGRRHVPQEVIRFIDAEISGARGLIPRTVDSGLCDADYIATRLVEEILSGKTFESAAAILLAEWGITGTIPPKLLSKLVRAAEMIERRICLGRDINEFGVNLDYDISSLPAIVRKHAEAIRGEVRAGVFEIAGTAEHYYLRLAPRARFDRRIEEPLARHYQKFIDEYSEEVPEELRRRINNEIILKVGGRENNVERFVALVLGETARGRNVAQIVAALRTWPNMSKIEEKELVAIIKELRSRSWLSRFFSHASDNLADIGTRLGSGYNIVESFIALSPDTYSQEEAAALRQAALPIRGTLEEMTVKRDLGAITLVPGPGGRLVVWRGEMLGVKGHEAAKRKLEQYYHYIISPNGQSAEQAAEELIVTNRLPEMQVRKEKIGDEMCRPRFAAAIRELAPRLETAFEKIREGLSEADRDVRLDDRIRKLGFEAIGKVASEMEGVAEANGITDYLKEKTPQISVLKYTGIQLDDADYRSPEDAALWQIPYLQERKSIYMTGMRQFGREKGKPIADSFQSGGNAYWNFPNIEGSDPNNGAVASWGSCTAYSTRAYDESSWWITQIPYVSRLSNGGERYEGKFKLTKLVKSESYPAKLLKLGLSAVDLAYAFSALQFADAGHFLSRTGRMPEFLARRLEMPVDEKKIIAGDVHEIWAVQDTTTESEDIASCIRFLRGILSMDGNGVNHLWNGLFLEGTGPLGAHSDSLAGANTTFYARWARGNQPILWDILFSEMGWRRKIHFASLSLFWLTGFFRPALIAMPLFFMFGGLSSVIMGKTPEQAAVFLAMVGATFGINMSSFLGVMRSRGFLEKGYLKETLGCLYIEFGGLGRMLQSFYEGTVWGERPPFVPSPKESIARERVPWSTLWFEMSLAGSNLLALAYAHDYVLSQQGQAGMFAAAFWTLLHAGVGAGTLLAFNRGIYRGRVDDDPSRLDEEGSKSLEIKEGVRNAFAN